MNKKQISKFLSLVLRHKPEEIQLPLDAEGWASTTELIQKMNQRGMAIDLTLLQEVVKGNDKQRFKLSEDLSKIRANQGHSIPINLGLNAVSPPSILYHGTARRNISSIKKKGLLKGARQHVHLSQDKETAQKVGKRHGAPVIFKVDSQGMNKAGKAFFQSENGVWLTDQVDPQFLSLISAEGNSIQAIMQQDLHDEELFTQAHSYGMAYLREAAERHVFPMDEALEDLAKFDEPMPPTPQNSQEVLAFLHRYGAPATVSQIAGRYYGFVNGSVVPTGLAAKLLASFWDQNTAMQVISPLASKLEQVVEAWLKDLFALPESVVAGFVSGTSTANLCGLAAARYRLLAQQGWDLNQKGVFGAPRLRVVTGRHAHSTILKAISLMGFGQAHIEWVEVDGQGRLMLDQTPKLDERTLLILQAGNVNSGSFDPFQSLCQQAREVGAWVHIDGAFGLWAQAVPQLAHLTEGMEGAHSWAVDGHKTLNTPYDSGIILCADREALAAALHMTGSYLIKGKDRDGMYYTPEMSRRSRIIELWATLKFLGKQGIGEMIVGLHHRALQFAELLSKVEGFEVLNEVVFNQVIVQCQSDVLTEQVITRIQAMRECWVGGSSWKGRKVIRISVCAWTTTEEDVRRSVQSFQQALQDISMQL
ncbi:MAG: RNA 2'-phosphotransferase [Bacteroidota bacterium]